MNRRFVPWFCYLMKNLSFFCLHISQIITIFAADFLKKSGVLLRIFQENQK